MKFLKHYFLECKGNHFLWLVIGLLLGSILLSILSQNPGAIIGFLLIFFSDVIGEYFRYKKQNKNED